MKRSTEGEEKKALLQAQYFQAIAGEHAERSKSTDILSCFLFIRLSQTLILARFPTRQSYLTSMIDVLWAG